MLGRERAEAWNANVPVGQPVAVVRDDGTVLRTETRSSAWCLGDGSPVVKVDGIAGGYALERVIVRVGPDPV